MTTPIPLRLWIFEPIKTFRLWIYIARSGTSDYMTAAEELLVVQALDDLLRMNLAGPSANSTRRIVRRLVTIGAIPLARASELAQEEDPMTLLTAVMTLDRPTVA